MITQAPLLETKAPAVVPRNGESADEYIYLSGRPTLRRFLRFVRTNCTHHTRESALIEEWHAAQNHIRLLEKEEAGCPDNPPITQLDSHYEPLLIEFLKDPLVRGGFNTVPTEVALVELDRLVVHQKHIDLTFAQSLTTKLGRAPSEEEIFRTCLPFDHPHPPVQWSRVSRGKYAFMSPSNDLRFLGTMALDPENIADYPPPGSLVGVVGIAVGFGSNFLNAVYTSNRLILNNGSHRAFALRALGVTHVPCIIEHVSSPEELDLVAAEKVRSDPDYYIKSPRPPMLKDYFDPKLRKVLPVRRRHRQVMVRFEVDEEFVPALEPGGDSSSRMTLSGDARRDTRDCCGLEAAFRPERGK